MGIIGGVDRLTILNITPSGDPVAAVVNCKQCRHRCPLPCANGLARFTNVEEDAYVIRMVECDSTFKTGYGDTPEVFHCLKFSKCGFDCRRLETLDGNLHASYASFRDLCQMLQLKR